MRYSPAMAGNTIQITPVMHVADVAGAVRFFVEMLGFSGLIPRRFS